MSTAYDCYPATNGSEQHRNRRSVIIKLAGCWKQRGFTAAYCRSGLVRPDDLEIKGKTSRKKLRERSARPLSPRLATPQDIAILEMFYFAQDKLAEAEVSYRRALALDLNMPEAFNNLGQV